MNKKNLFLLVLILIQFGCPAIGQPFRWSVLPNNGLHNGIHRVNDVYFLNYQVGFAVSLQDKVFKTTDGGASWHTKGTDSTDFRCIEFLNDNQTGLIGALSGKVYRTTDVGETWTDITASIPTSAPKICGLASIGNTFYGVGWFGSKVANFYKSSDKGITWQVTEIDTNLATCLVDVVFLNADTGFVTGGRSTIPYFSNESVVLKTTDGGTTWIQVFSDVSLGGRIWKIQALSQDTLFGSIEPYYTDSVVMIRSFDGGNTWAKVNTGFRMPSSNATQAIGFINGREGWLGGWYSYMVHTADGGDTWNIDSFGGSFNRIFVMDRHRAYAGAASVYRLDDSTYNALPVLDLTPIASHKLYPLVPNPVSGTITIQFDLITTTNVVLEVASIDTKAVEQIANTRLKPGHYTYYWDSRNARPGSYFVWLGTDETPLVEKFIIQH